jgi:hypothetical protein
MSRTICSSTRFASRLEPGDSVKTAEVWADITRQGSTERLREGSQPFLLHRQVESWCDIPMNGIHAHS